MATVGNCRSCGEPVVWSENTITRQTTPLNPKPDERGNIVRTSDRQHVVLNKSGVTAARQDAKPLYLSHFATCPQAKEWRARP